MRSNLPLLCAFLIQINARSGKLVGGCDGGYHPEMAFSDVAANGVRSATNWRRLERDTATSTAAPGRTDGTRQTGPRRAPAPAPPGRSAAWPAGSAGEIDIRMAGSADWAPLPAG